MIRGACASQVALGMVAWNVQATVTLEKGDRVELVDLSGMTEIHSYPAGDGDQRIEVVQLYLNGPSEVLGRKSW